MDLGLDGKVAIVSGSSRGIGRAIAAALSREGCSVALCARGREPLEAVAAELRAGGGAVTAVCADITSTDGQDTLVAQTLQAFGRIDVLVNNVGGGGGSTFVETADADWQAGFDLTVAPAVRLSRLVVPEMARQGGGSIVMVTSIFGREWGRRPVYMTVKAAEIALSKAMARELAPQNIRVNSVAPGSIRFSGGSWDRRCVQDPEGMAKFVASELPVGRFGKPEEVADAVAFLASERASLIVGVCLNVDGGQSRSLF